MKKVRLTTAQAAIELDVCVQRVAAKIAQGHFPGAGRCECGRSMMIPAREVDRNKKEKSKR